MSQDIVTHLEEARLLLAKREFDAAQRVLRQALALDSTLAETLNLTGVALELQGRLEEAARYYRAALSLQPDHAMANANLERATRWQYRPDGIRRNLESPKR